MSKDSIERNSFQLDMSTTTTKYNQVRTKGKAQAGDRGMDTH